MQPELDPRDGESSGPLIVIPHRVKEEV